MVFVLSQMVKRLLDRMLTDSQPLINADER